MENKLIELQDKIGQIEKALDDVKHFVSESDVTKAIDESFKAEMMLAAVLDELQDIEMADVDFSNINLDTAFENNPVSDYVSALADYSLGDVEATKRMMDAMERITQTKVVTSEEGATDLLNRILDTEEEHAKQLEQALEAIEHVLEGTKIDNWTEDQVELARYFIQFQPDTTLTEVELLTPHGVKMVWKRRRYLGAAK